MVVSVHAMVKAMKLATRKLDPVLAITHTFPCPLLILAFSSQGIF